MKRIKLTPLAKGIILIILLSCIGFGIYKTGAVQRVLSKKNNLTSNSQSNSQLSNQKNEINISLDEWIGWKSIIDANGGLTTKKGSIYDELGIKVNISVINDATQSSNALISNKINGAGYTINRYAFLYNKFKEANVDVVMPYIHNSSSGGDGIIAKSGINSINDLVGKVIGIPRYSEAQTLVEWLLNKSNLNDSQKNEIRNKMVFFETPDDTAKAFFAGKIDAAATWEPYLSQARETTNCSVLFSTKDATSIILDGIVFRKDFVESNKELIAKFIEGALKAGDQLYETEFNSIKDSMPLFATESNDSIKSMLKNAKIINGNTNIDMLALNSTASSLFTDMSKIWEQLGEKVHIDQANNAFSDEIIKSISDKFINETKQNITFTQEQRENALSIDNIQSLLEQNLTINFAPDSAVILEDSYAQLDEFVKTAKILDGTIIQIEGNVANVDTGTNKEEEINKKLSEQRAKSVANYLSANGIDATRFVIVGNGTSKTIGDNSTEEGRQKNRRTDIFFKRIER